MKLRHKREVFGKLVAFDDHLNLMLGDAREKVTEEVVDAAGGVSQKVTER